MNKKIKCSIHIIMTAYFSFDLLSSLELSVSEVSTGPGEVTWIDSVVSRGRTVSNTSESRELSGTEVFWDVSWSREENSVDFCWSGDITFTDVCPSRKLIIWVTKAGKTKLSSVLLRTILGLFIVVGLQPSSLTDSSFPMTYFQAE